MSIKTLAQRHPVTSYFVLAYAISWGGSLAAVGPKFLRGESIELIDALFIFLPMLAGPSLAGITMTAIVDGRSGLRDLLSRMCRWRVGVRWYAAALLIPPILIPTVLLTLSSLVSPVFFPGFFAAGAVVGLLAGFFEEIGWMGFAYPKMEPRHSALATSIHLGLLWTFWHIVADYLATADVMGAYWLPHFLVWMVATFTAMRVLIVWVYTNTRSLLLAQLMHASSSGFAAVLAPALSPTEDMLYYGVYAAVLWLIVVVVAKLYGKHLVRQPMSVEAI